MVFRLPHPGLFPIHLFLETPKTQASFCLLSAPQVIPGTICPEGEPWVTQRLSAHCKLFDLGETASLSGPQQAQDKQGLRKPWEKQSGVLQRPWHPDCMSLSPAVANVHGRLHRPERAAAGTPQLLDLSAQPGPHRKTKGSIIYVQSVYSDMYQCLLVFPMIFTLYSCHQGLFK